MAGAKPSVGDRLAHLLGDARRVEAQLAAQVAHGAVVDEVIGAAGR